MRKHSVVVLLVSVALLAVALGASAQEMAKKPGEIARVFFVKVKPGMEKQFEEAYKQHLKWHEDKKDTWAWTTYVYETGDHMGEYIIRAPGHHWVDFDTRGEMGKEDSADAREKLFPLVESLRSEFTRLHSDVSRMPENFADYALFEVTTVKLRQGGVGDFLYVMKKYAAAAEKTNRPGYFALLQPMAGTDEPTYVFVTPMKAWADMEPSEVSVHKMMVEVYGEMEAESLRHKFFKAVQGMHTEIVRYRPDLSYVPGGGM